MVVVNMERGDGIVNYKRERNRQGSERETEREKERWGEVKEWV